ncbi:unnamed protein product [Closterium sp. NIES-65]|nr:unnamed protein product [Closterium sp. NIES-65]
MLVSYFYCVVPFSTLIRSLTSSFLYPLSPCALIPPARSSPHSSPFLPQRANEAMQGERGVWFECAQGGGEGQQASSETSQRRCRGEGEQAARHSSQLEVQGVSCISSPFPLSFRLPSFPPLPVPLCPSSFAVPLSLFPPFPFLFCPSSFAHPPLSVPLCPSPFARPPLPIPLCPSPFAPRPLFPSSLPVPLCPSPFARPFLPFPFHPFSFARPPFAPQALTIGGSGPSCLFAFCDVAFKEGSVFC